MFAVEPDDMEAVTRRDRRLAQLPWRKRDKGLLEFRRRLPGGDLAEIAALRRRRAARMRLRKFGKPRGLLAQFGEHRGGILVCLGMRRAIRGQRRKQDVRGLVDIGRAEARAVAVVIAPAGFIVRFGDRNLAIDQTADDCFFVGFAASVAVTQRLRCDSEAARLLQQQLADDQRARGLLPGRDRLGRRVVLHFAHDGVAGDRYAVHADLNRFFCRYLRVGRAGCHRGHSARKAPRVRVVRTT